MSKCVNDNEGTAPVLNDFGFKPGFSVGQLVMRVPCVKGGKATGPFIIKATYRLRRGTRYRIERPGTGRGAGVLPSMIRAATTQEIKAYHQATDYKLLDLWI